MPKIVFRQPVALVRSEKPGALELYSADAVEYLDVAPTTPESLMLENGVKLLGVRVTPQGDDALIGSIDLLLDIGDSDWAPMELSLNDYGGARALATKVSAKENKLQYVVVKFLLTNFTSAPAGIYNLLIA